MSIDAVLDAHSGENEHPTNCPECGTLLDGYTDVSFNGAKPQPGDWALCLECGTPLRFDENLVQRRLTEADKAEASPQVREMMTRSAMAIETIRAEAKP